MSLPPKIKICGMRHSQNIKDLVQLSPDYIGFIFYEKSPRYAAPILKPEITRDIPKQIKKTGVFVNEPLKRMLSVCEKYTLNTVQLHGNEPAETCHELQKQGYEVIKTFSLKTPADIEKTRAYSDFCNYFLFDTPTNAHGGSGRKFDWSVLREVTPEQPFFLSGGIEEGHAFTILKEVPREPYALDINSRFETAPGLKNIESIKQFMTIIRKQH
jgi:phosphoribosylanthranilate isomerase